MVFARDLARGRAGRRQRQKGAALLLVLIFGILFMVLVLTLLNLGTMSVKGQADAHAQLQLHCVCRAGIASAINEINISRLDPPAGQTAANPDPGGDGKGAMTVDPIDGLPGIAVRDPAGRILGRFRATVKADGTANRLTVVAIGPGDSFADFANVQHVVAAKVEIDRGRPPFPANAISLTGDVMAGYTGTKAAFEVGSNNITVQADGFAVPAVNATDTSAYLDVINPSPSSNSIVAGVGNDLTGADPNNPGTMATGAATVTNEAAGVLSQATMNSIAQGIDDYVAAHTIGNNGTVNVLQAIRNKDAGALDANNKMTGSVTLDNGTYRLDNDMELSGTLIGSGTLIITKKMLLKTELRWTGNVIIQSDGAELTMETAKLNVTGVLALQAIGSTATMMLKGEINIVGALTVLCDAGADMTVDPGAKIDITGVMAMMGQDIGFNVGNGGHLNITGSMAIAVPEGATTGITKINLDQGSSGTLAFNQTNFTSGINALGAFFDPDGTKLPISPSKYWEQDSNPNARDELNPSFNGGQAAQVQAGGNMGLP